MTTQQLLPYLAPLLVIALVGRRLIRNAPRKVKPWRVFIGPLIVIAAVIATFAMTPLPGPLWIAGFVVALAAGGAIGFLTTHHQEFALDPETGEITSRATPIGLLLVGGFFIVRFGLKFVMSGGNPYGPQNYQPDLHPTMTAIAWTDVGIMFALGLVIARAVTTWLRARPLIAQRAEAKAAGQVSAPSPSPPAESPPRQD
jgi:hypothetical protein